MERPPADLVHAATIDLEGVRVLADWLGERGFELDPVTIDIGDEVQARPSAGWLVAGIMNSSDWDGDDQVALARVAAWRAWTRAPRTAEAIVDESGATILPRWRFTDLIQAVSGAFASDASAVRDALEKALSPVEAIGFWSEPFPLQTGDETVEQLRLLVDTAALVRRLLDPWAQTAVLLLEHPLVDRDELLDLALTRVAERRGKH